MKKSSLMVWLVATAMVMASTCFADGYTEARLYGGGFIFTSFVNTTEVYRGAYDGLPTDHYVDRTVLNVKRLPALGIPKSMPAIRVKDTGGQEGYVPVFLPIPDDAVFYRTTTTRQKFTVSGTNLAVLPESQFLEQDVITTYKGSLPGELPRVLTWTEHLTKSYGTPDWGWRLGEGAGGYQSYLPRPSVVGAMKTSIDGDDIVTTQCKAFTMRVNAMGLNPDPATPNSYLIFKLRGVTEAGYETILVTIQVNWDKSTDVQVDLSGQKRPFGLYPELWERVSPPTTPPQTN